MAERDSFLRRWSRQKSAMRESVPAETPAQNPVPADTEAETAVDLSALPDIDALDLDSDFASFMQPGVPQALRKQALRKLWTLDPAFSQLDGLVEYGEDFTAKFRTQQVVRTVWQLAKGMPDPKAEDTEEAPEDVIAAEDGEKPSESEEPPHPENPGPEKTS